MNYSKRVIKEGITFHKITTKKFKTNLFSIFITTPLSRDTVTKNALLGAVLRMGTASLPAQDLISKELENMYGASFDCGVEKNGDNHILKFYIESLNDEFLPKVAAIVGEENICEFKTDLTTLDGLKPYAPLLSKISLPTLDFYRKNVEIFDKYNPDSWWWLATPESAKPHSRPSWTVCVSPVGSISGDYCYNDGGVRPILNFVSSISVSCEE